MKTLAIIAAHPDDEALGCGGLILKEKSLGSSIHCLFMTNGIDARENLSTKDMTLRHQGVLSAMKLIKPNSYKLLDFPDNKLDTIPLLDLTKSIEAFLENIQPDVIVTHFAHDLNVDHALTCRAVMTAARPGSMTFAREIYSFEVPSSTEWAFGNNQFHPDTYVDISDLIEQKKEYLNSYASEMRPYPHPRSVENAVALNQLRGAQMNLRFAEAFISLRRIL